MKDNTLLITGLLAITVSVSFSANCPNASPEVITPPSLSGDTYNPGSIATYISGLANLLSVGDLDPVQSSIAEYHYKVCCTDSQPGDSQKDLSKHVESVNTSLTLGVGEDIGLSTPFEAIENAATELGIPSYWAGQLADYLSGFAATLASVSYDYQAGFSNWEECDKCQRDTTSRAFVGSESHTVGGSIGGYHPEVPGGYLIDISLLEIDLSWEKSGYIGNNVAYQSIHIEGAITSSIQLGDNEPETVTHFTQADITSPSSLPYFSNGNYGLF